MTGCPAEVRIGAEWVERTVTGPASAMTARGGALARP